MAYESYQNILCAFYSSNKSYKCLVLAENWQDLVFCKNPCNRMNKGAQLVHPHFFCPAPKLYKYTNYFFCPAPKLYIYMHPRYFVQLGASEDERRFFLFAKQQKSRVDFYVVSNSSTSYLICIGMPCMYYIKAMYLHFA